METEIVERGSEGGGGSNGVNFVKEVARNGIGSKCEKSCIKFLFYHLLLHGAESSLRSLTGSQIVKKFSIFYGTHHLSLS
jgi:hypothetical protein